MEAGETVFKHPTVVRLLEACKPLWALSYARNLMSWDTATYMPPGGAAERGLASAEIMKLSRRLILDPSLEKLVEEAESRIDELNVYERGVVRVLRREIKYAKAVTDELLARMARVSSEGLQAWRSAKEKERFDVWKPWLDEVISIARELAERLGYDEHPYDALLDIFEEGLRRSYVEKVFSNLIPRLKKLVEKVLADEFYPRRHPLEGAGYEKASMEKLLRRLLTILGYDWSRGRLDESPHPFTMPIAWGDVRITVRYEGYDPRRPILGAIHEFGHALYDQQIDRRLALTPIGSAAGLGIHESQSRLWELMVGQSYWFIRAVKHLLERYVPVFRDYDWLEVYRYFNLVRPSLVRVEADELTYHMHVYLRYRIEEMMVRGEIRASDVPELWDRMMEELLGVRPRKPSEGVLQDIHWAECYVGYFPTYTLGTLLAARIFKRFTREVEDGLEKLEKLDFTVLREWLREKIHRWGSTFPPRELAEKAVGGYAEPDDFLEYAEWKYLRLPGELV